jgi:hypothetical protein
MKKVVIFIAAIAFLSFSCNKYCKCDYYVDGKLQKKDKFKSEFINEKGNCKDYSEPLKEIEGITYETKCK